ncbi:tripartite-type tricarboxylate transporter receptor subunit TctC [Sporomusaceae bacterium BoRhaA]|nr:tripartite-type tricarboxylate transporter receptor subunit TctC [Pelorhabdus rhamnosifermentans]
MTSEHRPSDPAFANVPTLKELKVNLAFTYWYGIASLPADLKKTLAEGFKAMIADPEFKTGLENMGLQIDYLDPDESEQKWLTN